MPQLIEVASSGNGCWRLGYVNPIENLWSQLTRRAEGRNPAPQNLSDLRAVLQEEWDAMPQQTISRFVKSLRHHGHAVMDAQGRMTSYCDI